MRTSRHILPALLLGLGFAASLTAQEIAVEELPEESQEAAPAPATEPPQAAIPGASQEEAVLPSGPEELESAAIRLYSEGDLSAALTLYLRLGTTLPDPRERARHLLTAAWLSWQLQDPAAALREMEEALYLAPDAEFRAEIYHPEFASLYQDALRNAVHRRQVDASNKINQAVGELRARRFAAARRLLLEALDLSPNDPDGVYNLALVDLREGHKDAALAGFERVLALERGNPEGVTSKLKSQALNNSAIIYFEREAYDEAEAALSEAVGIDSSDGKSWYNLALARLKLGRGEEAYAALGRAHQLAPQDLDVTRALGLAEIERQGWTAAVALLGEASRAQPGNADLAFQLGRAQRGLGNLDGAAQSFARALELDPDNAAGVGSPAVLLLAETQQKRGDVSAATTAAERATAMRPEDGGAWMFLGLAHLAGGDLRQARKDLEKARELAPDRADIVHNLGSVYNAQRDLPLAEETFEAALALDPGNPATIGALAALRNRPPNPDAEKSFYVGAELTALADNGAGLKGLRVDAIELATPAARAGLRVGDLLQFAGDRELDNVNDLRRALRSGRGVVQVSLVREGETLSLKLVVAR